eukprot:3688381-Amphidinium_carterae.1
MKVAPIEASAEKGTVVGVKPGWSPRQVPSRGWPPSFMDLLGGTIPLSTLDTHRGDHPPLGTYHGVLRP